MLNSSKKVHVRSVYERAFDTQTDSHVNTISSCVNSFCSVLVVFKNTSVSFSIAQQQRIDVVLVDTAGRMQNNEPLMRSLAKVIECS